jgi:AraC family transcriptional regulator
MMSVRRTKCRLSAARQTCILGTSISSSKQCGRAEWESIMLDGDNLIAQLDVGGSSVSLIRPRPSRNFHETYSGKRHLLAMYRLPSIPAAGRYLETGRREFSPIGPVFFRPAGLHLECRGEATNVSALHCQFDDERLGRAGLATARWSERQLASALDVQASHLFSYCARLINELTRPGFGSAAIADSLLTIILTDLARYVAGAAQAPERTSDLREQTFCMLVERICDVWEVTPRVSELADMAGIGERHLLRVFRQRKGMSLADFIRETRLEKARYLLSQTDTPLKQVSHRLGFSSQSTFTTAFRGEVGVTPLAFRREHRQRRLMSG